MYEQYCNLLLSAASNYDASYAPKEAPFTCPKNHAVYMHDIQDDNFYDAQELDTGQNPPMILTSPLTHFKTMPTSRELHQNQAQVQLAYQLHG